LLYFLLLGLFDLTLDGDGSFVFRLLRFGFWWGWGFAWLFSREDVLVGRMFGGQRDGTGDVDLDGSAGSCAAPEIVMEESAYDSVENNSDDDAAMEQHGAGGRFRERLGSQLLLKVIAGLEEVAAHRL